MADVVPACSCCYCLIDAKQQEGGGDSTPSEFVILCCIIMCRMLRTLCFILILHGLVTIVLFVSYCCYAVDGAVKANYI